MAAFCVAADYPADYVWQIEARKQDGGLPHNHCEELNKVCTYKMLSIAKGEDDSGRRSSVYDLNTKAAAGYGAVMGTQTGMLIDYDMASKKCRKCDVSKRLGVPWTLQIIIIMANRRNIQTGIERHGQRGETLFLRRVTHTVDDCVRPILSERVPPETLNSCVHRFKIVIHGGIDGFSRILVFIKASLNNRKETVLDLFLSAASTYGVRYGVIGYKSMTRT